MSRACGALLRGLALDRSMRPSRIFVDAVDGSIEQHKRSSFQKSLTQTHFGHFATTSTSPHARDLD
jgi:hypothetical protein